MAVSFHRVIGGDLADLKRLMEAATEFLENQGVDAGAVFRINLTLEEIVTNIIKFGHDDSSLCHIDIEVRVKQGAVKAVIIDEGYEFNPVLHQMQKPPDALNDRTTGGLGIYLIKKLLGSMDYRREGRRNIVEVTAARRLDRSSEPD